MKKKEKRKKEQQNSKQNKRYTIQKKTDNEITK